MTTRTQPRFGKITREPEGTSCCIAFASELGWMAVAWNGQSVARNTFGWPSPAEALRAVEGHAGGAEPQLFDETTARHLDAALRRVIEQLQAFARGEEAELDEIPIDLTDRTSFQRKVIQRCRRIPRGATRSYGELARQCGHPGAARAVGNVMRTNRFPLIVPCHRVVGHGGRLGGYSAPEGLAMKRRLLALEAAVAAHG